MARLPLHRIGTAGLSLLVVWLLLVVACAPAPPPTPTPAPKPAAQPTPAPKPPAPAPTAAPAKPVTAAPTVAPPKPAAPAPTTAAPKPAASLQKISFRTDWLANARIAAFYLARERGYFQEAGLDVDIQEGRGSVQTAQVVAAGTEPIGDADGSVVVRAIAQGAPIKVVFGFMQKSPMSIVVLTSSGIKKPKDLEGKTIVGAAGGASETLLNPWLQYNGVDPSKIKLVSVAANVRATTFLEGKADATVGFVYDEVPTFRAKGVSSEAILYADYGFNPMGLGVIANETFLKEKPQAVRGFVAALTKGYEALRANPKEGVQPLLKAHQQLDPKVQEEMTPLVLALLNSKRTVGKPLGWMDQADWQDTVDLIVKHVDSNVKVRADQVFTNEFIPTR